MSVCDGINRIFFNSMYFSHEKLVTNYGTAYNYNDIVLIFFYLHILVTFARGAEEGSDLSATDTRDQDKQYRHV